MLRGPRNRERVWARDVTYAIGKADKYRLPGHDRVHELILVTIVLLFSFHDLLGLYLQYLLFMRR